MLPREQPWTIYSMKFQRSQRLKVRAGLDMTPLVDVVFLLLLFFMLSASFVVQNAIHIQAGETTGVPSFEEKDLTITLAHGEGGPGGNGPVYVNDVAVADLGELARVLAEAHADRPDLRVLIRPDARVESGQLIEILGIAQGAGIDHYSIAAQPLAQAAGK